MTAEQALAELESIMQAAYIMADTRLADCKHVAACPLDACACRRERRAFILAHQIVLTYTKKLAEDEHAKG